MKVTIKGVKLIIIFDISVLCVKKSQIADQNHTVLSLKCICRVGKKTTSSKKVREVTQGKRAVRHPENITDEDNTLEEPRL